MLAFSDTFNRDNGPLGPDWILESGAMDIYNGAARTTTTGRARPNRTPDGPNQCQRIWVREPASFPKTVQLRFRQDALQTTYIGVSIGFSASSISISGASYLAGVATNFPSATYPYTYGGDVGIMVSCMDTHILAWIDSVLVLGVTADIVTLPGNNSMAILSTNLYVDQYDYHDLTSPSLLPTVEADPINENHYAITLHNVGSDWTPGTPGSPTFEAVAGTIDSQEVTDADTAVIQWEAPDLTIPSYLYDPQNEFYHHFDIVTPGALQTGGGTGGGLTEEQAAILTALDAWMADYATGAGGSNSLFFNLGAIHLFLTSEWHDTQGYALADALNALIGTDGAMATVLNRIALIRQAQDDLTQSGSYSLPSVQEVIRGTSSRDLTQVYDLVAALQTGSNVDLDAILAELAAIRTASLWTLEHVRQWILAIPAADLTPVLNELALIRTANNWSLGHVMDAIAALPHTDYTSTLQTIYNLLLQIPTNPVTSLQPVLDSISFHNQNLNGKASDILAAIASIPTNPITSLQPVLDAIGSSLTTLNNHIQQVEDKVDALDLGSVTGGAPVWPGLANVNLGVPVSISESFTVTGPCDGVIIDISSVPTKLGYYWYDTQRSYRNLGSLSFYDDQGHQEYAITLGFTTAVYCPKTMRSAAGCRIRMAAQVVGTVTPWTVKTT